MYINAANLMKLYNPNSWVPIGFDNTILRLSSIHNILKLIPDIHEYSNTIHLKYLECHLSRIIYIKIIFKEYTMIILKENKVFYSPLDWRPTKSLDILTTYSIVTIHSLPTRFHFSLFWSHLSHCHSFNLLCLWLCKFVLKPIYILTMNHVKCQDLHS